MFLPLWKDSDKISHYKNDKMLKFDTFNNTKYKFLIKLHHVSELMEKLRQNQLVKFYKEFILSIIERIKLKISSFCHFCGHIIGEKF